MKHGEVAIGLDVGGTKIAAGLVDRQGRVLLRRTMPTDAAQGGPAVLEKALAGTCTRPQLPKGLLPALPPAPSTSDAKPHRSR